MTLEAKSSSSMTKLDRVKFTSFVIFFRYTICIARFHRRSIYFSWCLHTIYPWWHHQMEAFSALLALCEGNPPITGGFLSQRPVTRNFDVFFNLLLNKRLSKQFIRWLFQTPSRSSWCHCNDNQCPLLTNKSQISFVTVQLSLSSYVTSVSSTHLW